MKLFIFWALIVGWAGKSSAGHVVTCTSQDADVKFTIEFVSHPTTQALLAATFRDLQGITLYEWKAPINGVARRGFIKVSQRQPIGPYSLLITNILADRPQAGPGEVFPGTYTQMVQALSEPNVPLVRYELSCVSAD